MSHKRCMYLEDVACGLQFGLLLLICRGQRDGVLHTGLGSRLGKVFIQLNLQMTETRHQGVTLTLGQLFLVDIVHTAALISIKHFLSVWVERLGVASVCNLLDQRSPLVCINPLWVCSTYTR